MACILKIPTETTKGVVSFTTQERDKFILEDGNLQKRIKFLKDKWTFGLHHNWHNFNFDYNSLFDFSMAGETDLIEKNGNVVPLLPLDACNFSPSSFHYSKNDKFWDILYVARAVNFKNIPEFFKIIRQLYDEGKMYRVLLVSPIPDECKKGNHSPTVFCSIREEYDKTFSANEKDLFTLLTTDYRNPFPFDIPTISQFYKLSKIFVHSAKDERRCRVAGYAWACGMPVVSMAPVASLLPKDKQHKPNVYVAKDYDDFPNLIKEAVGFVDSSEYSKIAMIEAISETSEEATTEILKERLSIYCGGISSDNKYCLNNLDIRLGRHHGLGNHTNSIGWSIETLLNYLENQSIADMMTDIKSTDIEREITKYKEFGEFKNESFYQHKITFKSTLSYLYHRYEFIRKLRKLISGK